MEGEKFNALLSMLIMLFFMAGQNCIAQNSSAISDPRIELEENLLHISYDILNSIVSDKYTVRIEITDAEGKVFEANALNGDIGVAIDGGLNKHVTWDLEADSIYLNANINFTIFAKLEPRPEPISEKIVEDQPEKELAARDPEKPVTIEQKDFAPKVPEKDDSKEQEKDDPKVEEKIVPVLEDEEEASPGLETTSKVSSGKQFNRTGLILQSIPLPGLGLSRLKGKPHWLKGIAGYGCIGGALYFKQLANASYAEQNAANDARWETYYHDVAVWQDNIAMGLAGAALGIWVTDIIWTYFGSSELKKFPVYGDLNGFQIEADYEPVFSSPLIKVTYTF